MGSSKEIDREILDKRSGRFFHSVTERPKIILIVSIIAVIVCGIFLTGVKLNTNMESFIASDHPSVKMRRKVKEIFGLSDPIVIAVVKEGPDGVFNPQTLDLVTRLTDALTRIPSIDPERITSLATEKNIFGTEDGMEVEPFFEHPPNTREEVDAVRKAVMDFPLYIGSIVSPDGTSTLISAELLDKNRGDRAYDAVSELVKRVPLHGEKIYVAGNAAVSGYLGKYIITDSMRMTPAVIVVISIIMFIAYRRSRGVILPNFVVTAAVLISLGLMCAMHIPYYNITNALPVLLVAIGVADGIHIMGEYYEQAVRRPKASQREIIIRSMSEMWRPVTVTSATDVAGLLALSFTGFSPPMKAFGLFASIGVIVAWLFSLLMIPAALMLFQRQESPAFHVTTAEVHPQTDRFGRNMSRIGNLINRNPGWVIFFVGVIIVGGVAGAANLKVDDNRIESFQKDEPLYIADSVINKKFDGTVNLDVVIETPGTEDLFRPDNLRRIESLQEFFRKQPHVKNATSIVDYLKQMNRAINENNPDMYQLPDSADTAAQYFLLYSASGGPADFEQYMDYDYRMADLHVVMDSGWHSDLKKVIEGGQHYINETFNAPGIKAQLAGRADVDYHWLNDLARSHFRGVLFAFVAVWLMVSFSFRSLVAGLLALVPVSLAVLLIYAWMGMTGLPLGVSTSMFAAISIGCGVDFAIHIIDRLMTLVRREGYPLERAFRVLFPSTGRALLFNFSAIFFGFVIFNVSKVPAIDRFGVLVCISVIVSFSASLIILPPLVKLLNPNFLFVRERRADVINEKDGASHSAGKQGI